MIEVYLVFNNYTRIMFLACYHLIYGAVESSEIHILLKIKLEWIDYILIDYQVYLFKSTVLLEGSNIKLCNGL